MRPHYSGKKRRYGAPGHGLCGQELLMRLLVDEQRVIVEGHEGGLQVEGGSFGPLQMLAASLALCTASVVHTYGQTARLDLSELRVHVAWEYADDPYRVERFDLTLEVPATVSEARYAALVRAADTCTVQNTLSHPPNMRTQVVVAAATPVERHHHHT